MIFKRGKGQRSRRPQLMDGQDDISFRRSRTLQGTTSSSVKAVNQKRAELKSDRLKKQQKQKRRRNTASVLLGVAVLVIAVWYLIGQYTTGVGTISYQPTTTSKSNDQAYEKVINNYLGLHPSERFRFALNEDRLEQFISQESPEVKSIEVRGASANQADFAIGLRQPVASWKVGSSQSYVDKEGVSFNRNYFAAPSVAIVDNSGAANEGSGGKAVVSERFLRFLGRLIALVNASGLGEVKEASLPKGTARQIDIKINGRSYYVKTHIDRDPAATVEDIKRVAGYLTKKELSASYIDVRISGRAFYK